MRLLLVAVLVLTPALGIEVINHPSVDGTRETDVSGLVSQLVEMIKGLIKESIALNDLIEYDVAELSSELTGKISFTNLNLKGVATWLSEQPLKAVLTDAISLKFEAVPRWADLVLEGNYEIHGEIVYTPVTNPPSAQRKITGKGTLMMTLDAQCIVNGLLSPLSGALDDVLVDPEIHSAGLRLTNIKVDGVDSEEAINQYFAAKFQPFVEAKQTEIDKFVQDYVKNINAQKGGWLSYLLNLGLEMLLKDVTEPITATGQLSLTEITGGLINGHINVSNLKFEGLKSLGQLVLDYQLIRFVLSFKWPTAVLNVDDYDLVVKVPKLDWDLAGKGVLDGKWEDLSGEIIILPELDGLNLVGVKISIGLKLGSAQLNMENLKWHGEDVSEEVADFVAALPNNLKAIVKEVNKLLTQVVSPALVSTLKHMLTQREWSKYDDLAKVFMQTLPLSARDEL